MRLGSLLDYLGMMYPGVLPVVKAIPASRGESKTSSRTRLAARRYLWYVARPTREVVLAAIFSRAACDFGVMSSTVRFMSSWVQ